MQVHSTVHVAPTPHQAAQHPPHEALRSAIQMLPAPDRVVAWRFLVQRENLFDIARSLQMTPQEVRDVLHRAREGLPPLITKVERSEARASQEETSGAMEGNR